MHPKNISQPNKNINPSANNYGIKKDESIEGRESPKFWRALDSLSFEGEILLFTRTLESKFPSFLACFAIMMMLKEALLVSLFRLDNQPVQNLQSSDQKISLMNLSPIHVANWSLRCNILTVTYIVQLVI